MSFISIFESANCKASSNHTSGMACLACRTVGDFSLAGSVIYTTCEPCPMCLGAIWWARIETIYFASDRDDAARIGFDDAALYREVSLALPDRQLPLVRHHTAAANQLMEDWLKKEDKIRY